MENKLFTPQKKHRWLTTMLLLFIGILTAAASTGDNYYYRTTAYAYPTACGKVYWRTEATNTPAYQNSPYVANGQQYNVGQGVLTFYFYAQANDNYIFSHWVEGQSTNGSGASVSDDPSFNVLRTFNSTNSGNNSRTQIRYTAIFVQQTGLIKAKSADESKGSVTNSNPQNTEGQQVTLTANPDVSNGVMFLGWKKAPEGGTPQDGSEDGYFSKNRVLTLTANSETKGTYWAYFSDAADKVYIRMKNRKTGRFLSIYGNAKATPHSRTFSGNTAQDGYIFTNSLKMLSADDAQGNPSTVFLRAGHPGSAGVTIGATISAHGVNYPDLLNNNQFNTGDDKVLTMEKRGDYYRIFTPFKYNDDGTIITISSYLCDEGTDFAIMKTDVSDQEADWMIYSLDEATIEGAFGANAKEKFTKDGKYYTTMYTDFPYKLLDGVNAYYLYIKEELTHITDVVVFTPIEHGIVPANTAVILECPVVQNAGSSSTVVNRLQPLVEDNTLVIDDEDKVNEGANFLKGYIYVYGRNTQVSNNKRLMYVLSWNQRLGFYHSGNANMTPNKAYLLAPDVSDEETENFANTHTFSFGMPEDLGETTRVTMAELIGDDNESTPVFDLNGRKVAEGKNSEKLLREGIYVKKGKKFVVK